MGDPSIGSRGTPVWIDRAAIAVLLALNAALVAWNAYSYSPTELEVSQLPAGLSYLDLGTTDLGIVNPPLIRIIAAIPVWIASPETDWRHKDSKPTSRVERSVGSRFVQVNGATSIRLFRLARFGCIPFVVLGAYTCSRWAREMYGDRAAVCAAVIWTFSPYVLGYGALMSTDAHAASVGLFAVYAFWRWQRQIGPFNTICAGAALGFAQLSKFTLLLLYPVLFLLWLAFLFRSQQSRAAGRGTVRTVWHLSAVMAISVFVINAGYGFEGSFTRLGEYTFSSRTLSGLQTHTLATDGGGNRFRESALSEFPVPLPANYLLGIDLQKRDFERTWRCYCNGQWQSGGWWYFYTYALAVKTPIGVIGLFGLALLLTVCCSHYSAHWQDELYLLLPSATILICVSAHTSMTIHSRYIFASLPFLVVWMSKTARTFPHGNRAVGRITVALLCCSTIESAAVYPHSLGYFNTFAGGPEHGYQRLVDSNCAWGQDLLHLATWLDAHPTATPIGLAAFGPFDPRLAGIQFEIPPILPEQRTQPGHDMARRFGPTPGWYAIDVNLLAGATVPIHTGNGYREFVTTGDNNFRYFLRFDPMARAGYSIYIYHLSRDEVNRVRQELGMPSLPIEVARSRKQ